MKRASRLRRSSFETATGQFSWRRAAASAATSCGGAQGVRTLAGFDLDELGHQLEAFALNDRAMASRWASRARPERLCSRALTRR